jgi:hypothetical protein
MLTVYCRKVKTVKNIADYEYIVMVNADKIAEGKILKHRRSDGWAKLVKRIGEQGIEEAENCV